MKATAGGVKSGPVRAVSNSSVQVRFESGVTVVSCSRVIDCRTSGGGRVGIGCVGDAASPGTVLAGTGRSSTGKRGWPVTRSSTNTNPLLLTWATAATSRPSLRTVTSVGCAGRS